MVVKAARLCEPEVDRRCETACASERRQSQPEL